MKKIKILAILLTFSLFATNNIFATNENLKQTKTRELKIEKEEYITNNLTKKEKEKYYVKHYEIKQIIKKGIFTIVHYEHKKSYAQILVFFDDLNNLSIDPANEEYSKGELFIKCSPPVNLVTLKFLCDSLNANLKQQLNSEYSKEEIKNLGVNAKECFRIVDYNLGCGIRVNFNIYNKKFFKSIIDAISHPYYYENIKFLKSTLEKVRKKLEREKFLNDDLFKPEIYSRFSFGKFSDYNKLEELDKIKNNKEYLKKMHNNLYDASHFLIKINGRKNPNYKEVMKNIHENEYFKTKNIKKTYEKKYENQVEKKPYRKIELNSDDLLPIDDVNLKKCKYEARLFWDVSKIPEKERIVFLTKSQTYWELLRREMKKMGYEYITTMQHSFFCNKKDCNSLIFDELYYIDMYGYKKKYFEKEKLKENGKKIIKMLYEKIKNFSDKELFDFVYYDKYWNKKRVDKVNFYNSNNYIDLNFSDFYIKSYCLTNNPFNKKYFNFKSDRKIEFKIKDVMNSFKKYKDRFELLYNNNPDYIDLFVAKIKPKKEKDMFCFYENPLKQNFLNHNRINEKDYLKKYFLSLFNEKLIYKKFLKPNLFNKNLVMKEGDRFTYFLIKTEDLKKVEDYIFNKFKKEIKSYVPAKDEINKIKLKKIKDLNLEIKKENEVIKKYENILTDSKKFEKFLKKLKENYTDTYEMRIDDVKKIKKQINEIKNKKSANIEEKNLKKELKSLKKYIKEFEDNAKNKDYFTNKVKENIDKWINFNKNRIKKTYEKIKIINKLTYEDFINFYKNLKFSSSSHLKKQK